VNVAEDRHPSALTAGRPTGSRLDRLQLHRGLVNRVRRGPPLLRLLTGGRRVLARRQPRQPFAHVNPAALSNRPGPHRSNQGSAPFQFLEDLLHEYRKSRVLDCPIEEPGANRLDRTR